MVSKAQIERLHDRIDAIEARLSPHQAVAGCIVELPDGWDVDRIWRQHCLTYPEDELANLVIYVRRFAERHDADAIDGELPGSCALSSNGWRGCDYQSWRQLARQESTAGRDPHVTLRRPVEQIGQ